MGWVGLGDWMLYLHSLFCSFSTLYKYKDARSGRVIVKGAKSGFRFEFEEEM